MDPANPLTLVGLMLTLSSLVGSFFYIQLSQWLRDILVVTSRLKAHAGTIDGDKTGREALRSEHERLSSWPTYVVNAAVVLFVVFVMVIALLLIEGASEDPSYALVRLALLGFLVLFIGLSVLLYGAGLLQNRQNAKTLG